MDGTVAAGERHYQPGARPDKEIRSLCTFFAQSLRKTFAKNQSSINIFLFAD